MSKEAYYLKHYCNARNDRKIKKARLQIGIEAYSIFFMTLEVLREQQDFKYPLADLDILADDFGTSIQKIELVIRNYGLFNIDDDEQFFSPAQLRSLESWLEQKELNRLKGQKSGIARKKKLEESILKLSLFDSNEPRFNNGSTGVELREEKRRKINNKNKDSNYLTIENNFLQFIEDTRKIYKGNGDNNWFPTLLNYKNRQIGINSIGHLYIKGTGETLKPTEAKEIWEYIFKNKDALEEITPC